MNLLKIFSSTLLIFFYFELFGQNKDYKIYRTEIDEFKKKKPTYLFQSYIESSSKKTRWTFNEKGDTTERNVTLNNLNGKDSLDFLISKSDTLLTIRSIYNADKLIFEYWERKSKTDTLKYYYNSNNQIIKYDQVYSFTTYSDSSFYRGKEIIKKTKYDKGKLWRYEIWNYNNNKLTKVEEYDNDSILLSRKLFTYDSRGRTTKMNIDRFRKSSVNRESTLSYYRRNRKTPFTKRMEDEKQITIIQFNKKFNPITRTIYLKDTRLTIEDKYLY